MRKLIHDFIDTIFYIAYLGIHEDYKNYIKRWNTVKIASSKSVHILANGPSLNGFIDELDTNWNRYKTDDFCVVNYIANQKIYEKVKPKYYVLSDPQFFLDSHPDSYKAKKMFDNINERTSWNMNLYVPYFYYKKFLSVRNEHIKVIPLHTRQYVGLEKLRFWFYEKGLGNGEFGTVVQNAIYTMINLRYKTIYLYGVDHNFFDGLCLDNHNRLCTQISHFYDKDKELRKKPVSIGLSVDLKTYEFLEYYACLFRGHHILNQYALSQGCSVINCTKGSLIDAYKFE